MSGFGFRIQSANYGTFEILRLNKDGSIEAVTTTNDDYPTPPPGEKLAWIVGITKPYTFDTDEKNEETGEITKKTIEMVQLEFQNLAGPRKGERFLISVTTSVTKGTNLGKIKAAATNQDIVGKQDFDPAEIMRKPFFVTTSNEQKANYIKTKFVMARPYDELVDGPIGGQAAPAPQPAAVAAADDGAALFDVDL
jgi:hypothetical protein